MADSNSENTSFRYIGVRPYEENQSPLFFGRNKETDLLLSMVFSEKLTVLFGKSGYGKSSLINAGLIPKLKALNKKGKQKYIPIKIRLNAIENQQIGILKRFEFFLNEAMKKANIPNSEITADELPPTLWGLFKQWASSEKSVFVLIFDQFEEFFSYPEPTQKLFKWQLKELLYSKFPSFLEENEDNLEPDIFQFLSVWLNVKVVFSIRSDRLSELDRLRKPLPAILHKRIELKALTKNQAIEAIKEPAKIPQGNNSIITQSFDYSEDAIEKILEKLFDNKKNVLGVEAFQLQIVCSFIEKKTQLEKLTLIQKENLPNFDQVYENYYRSKINEISLDADRVLVSKILEYGLLHYEEDLKISRRVSRDTGELAQSFDVTDNLLKKLEDTYLIRREVNTLSGFSYEISHDTLIEPILKSRLKKEEKAKHYARKEEFLKKEEERKLALLRAEKETERAKIEHEKRIKAERLQKEANELRIKAMEAKDQAMESLTFAEEQKNVALEKSRQARRATVLAVTALFLTIFMLIIAIKLRMDALNSLNIATQNLCNAWVEEKERLRIEIEKLESEKMAYFTAEQKSSGIAKQEEIKKKQTRLNEIETNQKEQACKNSQ